MYSQNSFEDKPLLRSLVPFAMGANYFIILLPNWTNIFAKVQDKEEITQEYKNISACPVHSMIVEKMASSAEKDMRLCRR